MQLGNHERSCRLCLRVGQVDFGLGLEEFGVVKQNAFTTAQPAFEYLTKDVNNACLDRLGQVRVPNYFEPIVHNGAVKAG